jgi:hypothetical protein
LAMYLNEAIVLKEKQVKERFQEMAEQRGFADPIPPEEEISEEASILKRMKLDKIFGKKRGGLVVAGGAFLILSA